MVMTITPRKKKAVSYLKADVDINTTYVNSMGTKIITSQ